MSRETAASESKAKASEHHRLPELREKLARLKKLSADDLKGHVWQGFDVKAAIERAERHITELEALK
jgi:hypothetical protein